MLPSRAVRPACLPGGGAAKKQKLGKQKAEIAQANSEKLKSWNLHSRQKVESRTADLGPEGALPNLFGAAHQRRQRQRSALPIPVNAILALLDRGEQSELR